MSETSKRVLEDAEQPRDRRWPLTAVELDALTLAREVEAAEKRIVELESRTSTGDEARDYKALLDSIAGLTGTALRGTYTPGDLPGRVAALVKRIAELETAAREYLMRSVPDPNTGPAAEDALREALAKGGK